MRRLSYIFYVLIYQPLLKVYLKSDSNITFDGFELKIYKGVFHPNLFFSTKYFYSFLKKQDLAGKKFLEIGCGSGILSLLAHSKGAAVTAIDIDPKAVDNTALNFSKNVKAAGQVTILQSDLFKSLPGQRYDVIVINPPYYFKKITTDTQYAWYCGENGEYFENLFLSLRYHKQPGAAVYMILEENCEIDRIRTIAGKNGLGFELADEKLIKWERNYIFRINSIGPDSENETLKHQQTS